MQGKKQNVNHSPRRVISDTRKLFWNNSVWRIISLLSVAIAIFCINLVRFSCETYAEGSAYTFTVSVPETPVLEITLLDGESQVTTGGTVSVVPSMAYAGFNEVGVNVRVGTSNTGGYTLAMNVPNNALTATSGATIPSLAVDSTNHPNGYACTYLTRETCDFTVNTWGYRIASQTSEFPSGSNYLPVPNHQLLDNYTTGATNGRITSVYFGSRINATKPAGTYTTTINFVAVANTSEEKPYMQNITNSDIASVIGEVGATGYLYDNRDESVYLIGHLADGNYWMLQNLALDPAGLINQLSINNTNLNPEVAFTLPNSISANFSSYTTPQLNTASKNTKVALAMQGDNTSTAAKNEPVGVYYNYCAATAGTYCMEENSGSGNAEYDICPAGWRLPTGGAVNATTGTGDFQNLRNKYTSNLDFVNALHVGLSGGFYDGSAYGQGSLGDFWSSTYYSATLMYDLYVNTTNVYPRNYYRRDGGFSVRCVFDQSSPSAHGVKTMQDLASLSSEAKTTLLADMTTGKTYYLRDNRDNRYYRVAKLKDGKIWMLDNLALDPTDSNTTLDASNTNATTEQLTAFLDPVSGVKNVSADFTSYTVPMINTTSKNTKVALAMQGDNTSTAAKNEPIGVYYNYCAATVGTYCYASGAGVDVADTSKDAPYDICPKGWRLPTGGAVNATYGGDFQNLRNKYTSNLDFVNALHAGLSGHFYNGSALNQGSYGRFWSSTYYSAADMYDLYVGTTDVYPQYGNSRYGGFSVRCVFGG